MSWLSKAFKKAVKFVGRIGGNDKYGDWTAWGLMGPGKTEQAAQASEAEAEARRKQHEEEVMSLAQGARASVARRRKRGYRSTILTGGGPDETGAPIGTGGKAKPLGY